jgi:hypothetical protein
MLKIRPEQMSAFEQAARRRFEDEMVVHSKGFATRLCEVIGDGQVRLAVRSAMARAATYGFTDRGPVQLFIEMTLLCGSGFDTDPQYPAVGECLRAPSDQMQRAEEIHAGYCDFLERVSGAGASNVYRALKELLQLARAPLKLADDFVPGLVQEMSRIFPQKVAYSGAAGLNGLMEEALAEARLYGFTTVRQQVLIVTLKFAFGHGCTDDPLYPWISRTLQDRKIKSPQARAARLEKKAVTWLEHVIADNERGATA